MSPRCSECGEPATYSGVREPDRTIDQRGPAAPPTVLHRVPFCTACAERLEARNALRSCSIIRL